MIDLIALKDFLVLCQTRNFSRAAERCHVSVSGLSRRIQALENWLGTTAFERGKTSLELTPAGQQLQSVATEVVYALDGLQKTVRKSLEGEDQQIRFASPHIMSAIFFPDWIPRLHSEFKSARFSVASDNLPECFNALQNGSADFVVTLLDQAGVVMERARARSGDEYLSLELGDEYLIPVCAPDSAGRPLFSLESTHSQPISFLGYDSECSLGWALDHALTSLPTPELVRMHKSSLADGLRAMALSRLGVAWLPESMLRTELARRSLVPAGGEHFNIPMKVNILRKGNHLNAQAQEFWLRLTLNPSPKNVEFSSSNSLAA